MKSHKNYMSFVVILIILINITVQTKLHSSSKSPASDYLQGYNSFASSLLVPKSKKFKFN